MFDKIRFIGRHLNKTGEVYFSFSGTGFEFKVKPNKSQFEINISLESDLKEHPFQYLGVYIDDEFYSKVKIGGSDQKIKLTLNHTKPIIVRIIKLNEVYLSAIHLKDITLSGAELLDVEPSNRPLVGFFGDSITCGYGLLDYGGNEFKMETEDFSKTYAYLACFSLKLDYSVVARSGISMALPIWVDKLIGEVYDTVDMYEKCKEEKTLDYAVINLGANDNGALNNSKNKEEDLKLFKNKYLDFVERIIKDNPKVKIVMCYNALPVANVISDAIKDVYKIISTCFKNKILLLELVPNQEGANCHPYYTAHEENAIKLANAIKELR